MKFDLRRTARYAIAIVLSCAQALPAAGLNELSDVEQGEGYVLLFNGKDLDGWDGDPDLWSVKGGVLVGSSDGKKVETNTFLIHTNQASDFILRAEVRLRNGNSGIQFRSRHVPGPGWIVHGYQADFSHAGERSAWGNFYEEKGRGRHVMKTTDEGWRNAESIVRKDGWNEYEIFAQGKRIRLTLNGKVTIDTEDDLSSEGVIAFQLHSGEAMQVECRNIRIRSLP